MNESKLNICDEDEKFFKRFSIDAKKVSGGWLLDFEHKTAPSALTPLMMHASRAQNSEELLHFWDIAHTLGLRRQFLELLPDSSKYEITDQISQEILKNLDSIGIAVDIDLVSFSTERGGSPRKMYLPDSRFVDILEANDILQRIPQIVGDDYYSNRVRDFCLLAEPYKVASFLEALPPGQTLIDGIDEVWRQRPRLLADLIHPSFIGTAAFALTRLPKNTYVHHIRQQPDLSTEWDNFQLSARIVLCKQDRCEISNLIAQGIRDFSYDAQSRMARVASQSDYCWSEIAWKKALEDDVQHLRIFNALSEYLRGDSCDEFGILFSLQLLKWSNVNDSNVRTELLEGIVYRYKELLTPRAKHRRPITYLAAFPVLLSLLWNEISGDSKLRRKWLYPFSIKHLCDQVNEECTTRDTVPEYSFDVSRIVKEHLSVIATQGNATEAPELIIDAVRSQVAEVFERDWKDCAFFPFAWYNLMNRNEDQLVGVRSLFQEIGQLFSKSQNAKIIAEQLIESKPHIQVLAEILSGNSNQEAFTKIIRAQMHSQLEEFFKENSTVCLGEALNVAVALLDADEPSFAEQCARLALSMLGDQPSGAGIIFQQEAQINLADALSRQNKWNEILTLKLKDETPESDIFVRNLRAIAHINKNELDEAEKELEAILRLDRYNEEGWVKRCVVALLKNQFEEAIVFVAKARKALGEIGIDKLALIEEAAIRRETIDFSDQPNTKNDTPKLSRAFSNQTKHDITDCDVQKLVERHITREKEKVDLAIITILQDEYDAVNDCLENSLYVIDDYDEAIPNSFAWKRGYISRDDDSRVRIVLAKTGNSGNLLSAQATMRTIDRFSPRYLFIVGIAGGINKDGLKQ